ncbi:hypothetical protein D8B26_002973 [Coccidioides posadasii str. Silveira]|uniref:uncharacterized protein n=1 Tax=Coccidioides posadasii (strain RMSCC 757 / Silveira) TaxID=443226 RepID=UPI001BEDA2C4|nr:hypothetical protein D8B26_002973 [Coccidioides posadasii str. Silveira]
MLLCVSITWWYKGLISDIAHSHMASSPHPGNPQVPFFTTAGRALCANKHRDPVCTRTLETEQIVWELGPIFTEREMFGHDLNKTKNQSMMWVLPALQPRLKALILDSKAYKDKNAVRNVLSILGPKGYPNVQLTSTD